MPIFLGKVGRFIAECLLVFQGMRVFPVESMVVLMTSLEIAFAILELVLLLRSVLSFLVVVIFPKVARLTFMDQPRRRPSAKGPSQLQCPGRGAKLEQVCYGMLTSSEAVER